MTQTVTVKPSAPLVPGRPTEPRNTRLVLIALGLCIFTGVLMNFYILYVRRQAAGQTFTVYRLVHGLDKGARLDAKDVETIKWPSNLESSIGDAVRQGVDLENLLGQQLDRPASQGQILTHMLFTPEPGAQMDLLKIPAGMVLATLPVDANQIAGGLVPGMKVDINAYFVLPGQAGKTLLVLENIKVVGVGNRAEGSTGGGGGSFRSITILVDPEIARQLITIRRFIGREGRDDFTIFIRNPDDSKTKLLLPPDQINPEVVKIIEGKNG